MGSSRELPAGWGPQGRRYPSYLAGQAAAHLARMLSRSGCLPATERSRGPESIAEGNEVGVQVEGCIGETGLLASGKEVFNG